MGHALIAEELSRALACRRAGRDPRAQLDRKSSGRSRFAVSPMRLAAFKGNTELKAGRLVQARATLQWALDSATTGDEKQSPVILGDLAAVEAAAGDPEAACGYAEQALDSLAVNWYATGMERIMAVRKALDAHADLDCVRRLDDRLYGWHNTLSALRH